MAVLSVIAVYIILCVLQWHRLPIQDEIFFHRAAFKWAVGGPQADGLWHTPFYLEGLRIWQKLFGIADPGRQGSVFILRSFGVFTGLLTAFLFLKGAKRKEGFLSSYPAIVLALLLLNPYFIQCSLLLDIDNTLMIPALVLWVLAVLKWDDAKNGSWSQTVVIAFISAFALMVKELTPLILIPTWICYSFLRPWRKPAESSFTHIIQSIIGIILGLSLFALVLIIWTQAHHMSWREPLELTLGKSKGKIGQYTPWDVLGIVRWIFLSYLPLVWLQIPTLFFLTKMALEKISAHKFFSIPLPFLFALAVYLCYSWLIQGSFYFAKYSAVVWPMLVLDFSMVIPLNLKKATECLNELKNSKKFILGFLFVWLFGICFFNCFEPLYIIEMRQDPNLNKLGWHFVSIALPIFLILMGVKIIKYQEKGIQNAVVVFGIIVTFLGHSLSQATMDSPGYLFGEEGLAQTIEEVKQLKIKISRGKPVLTTAVDVQWAFQNDAKLLVFEKEDYLKILDQYDILVSRTYDNYSVRYNPQWLTDVNSRFRCHQVINLPRERFEWWWKPLAKCEEGL